MRHADREDEKRHQHRERVQPVSQQRQRSELPDHRCQRAHEGERRQRPRARVAVDRQRRQREREHEEPDDALGTVGDVADLLGEADDLDLELRCLVLLADLLLEPL